MLSYPLLIYLADQFFQSSHSLGDVGGLFLDLIQQFREGVILGSAVGLHPGDIQAGLVAGQDLLIGKLAPSAVGILCTVGFGAGGQVTIFIALDELVKMAFFQRISFAEGGHIGAQVIEPNLMSVTFVLKTTGKEQNIGLDALSIENAGGQTKNGMQVALLHQVAADTLTITVSEQDIVRQNNRRTSLARLIQTAVDVLQEIQLLIAGGKSKVITGSTFSAFLGAERRIGQDNVITFHFLTKVGQRITKIDGTADIVQHGIHQGQTVGVMYQLTAGKCLSTLELLLIHRQFKQVISMVLDIAVSSDHKAKSTAGWVVAPLTGLGCNKSGHDIDENARREILPGTRLLLCRVLLQQAFVKIAQSFFLGTIPVELIDGLDDLFQVLGLVDVALCALIDLSDTASAALAQMLQQFLVELLQFHALFGNKLVPTILLRDGSLGAGFLAHFQEQDISQFRNILLISDTVITQHIAEIPKFCYDFLIVHATLPPSS